MKKRLSGILTLLLVLVVQIGFAQQKQVTGTVVDDQGLPLPGVNVLVKGTQRGTQTNFDGNYNITANAQDVLVFSYVGFEKAERIVGNAMQIDVTLATDAAELEEVVVMGYVTKRREDMTGSAVQVGSEDIQQTPMASVDQALQGKVAGLQISTSSGTPGATQDIRIRGISSINAGNDPLYVIDGVPIINQNAGDMDTGTSTLSSLASLNSNDVESITVLKDASATAAYGARGANGVIVITTKSGKSGKTSISVNSYYGFSNNAIDGPEPLTAAQQEILYYEGIMNTFGVGSMEEAQAFETASLGGDVFGFQAWNEAGRPVTDWKDLVTNQDAPVQEHVISATGGDDSHSFYTSLGYYNQEATVIASDFERISGALNFTKSISDRLEFSSSNNASHSYQDGLLEGSAYFSSPHTAKYFMSPLNQAYNEDGSINLYTSVPNPLFIAENDIDESRLTRILSNNSMSWDIPVEGLSFTSRFSVDYQVFDFKTYNNRINGDGDDTNGYGYNFNKTSATFTFQNSLDYNLNFDDHNFDFKLLQEFQKYNTHLIEAEGDNFAADGLTELSVAGNPTGASTEFTDWAVASYLATAAYNYGNRYVVNGTYRREGNSRFAADNRWGDFWSVGAAWNLHREDFLSNSSVVNNLKLRSSYGKTGNANIDINQYQVLFNYDANYAGTGAAYPPQYGNPNLTWETSYTFDAGVDFGLWGNRLTGSFAYYRRESNDLLLDVPLSMTTGFSSQYQNIGKMENQGIEAELDLSLVRGDDFNFSIGGNIATVKNEVLEVGVDANGNEVPVTNIDAPSGTQRSAKGSLVNEWFMPTWAGVDPDTGVDTWFINGVDGETTTSFVQAERAYQGTSALPSLTAGLNIHVDFKGFFVDASGYYAGGHQVYESWHLYLNQPNYYATGIYNGYNSLMDRWQKPGDQTRVTKSIFSGEPWRYNSKFLFDGDFFRLRNITFGYDFKPEVIESIGLSSARLFVKGSNLYTWVKDDYLQHDPEIDATGFTSITTPPVKTIAIGVNLKF